MVVNFNSNMEKYRSKDNQWLYYSSKNTLEHINTNLNNNTKNPLKGRRAATQPTFKGSFFSKLTKAEDIKIGVVRNHLRKYLGDTGNSGLNLNLEILKKHNINVRSVDKNALNITTSQHVWDSFKESVTFPFVAAGKAVHKLFSKEARVKYANEKEIQAAKSSLAGYYNETRQHEGYIKKLIEDKDNIANAIQKDGKEGFKNYLEGKKLANFNESAFQKACQKAAGSKESGIDNVQHVLNNIHDPKVNKKLFSEYITEAINSPEGKRLGGFMPKMSNDTVQFINRVTSGLTTAWFVSNDFHNLSIATKDDKKAANDQWNQRFTQQSTRIGISSYSGLIVNSTFANISNASLKIALGLAAASSVASDFVTRIVTGVPITPKIPDGVSTAPYVINAAPLKQNIYSASLNGTSNTVTANSASALSTYNLLKNSAGRLSNHANQSKKLSFGRNAAAETSKFLSKKIDLQQFEEIYHALKTAETADMHEKAEVMLKVATKHTLNNDKATIDELKNAAIDGKIINGKNAIHKLGYDLVETAKFPLNLAGKTFIVVGNIGRRLINLTRDKENKLSLVNGKDFDAIEWAVRNVRNIKRRLNNEELITKKSKANNYDRTFINFKKMYEDTKPKVYSKEAHYKAFRNLVASKCTSFHDPGVMDFPSSELSTYIKLTGFCTIPFLAMDAFNTVISTSKNMNIALAKTKERAAQDTTRQAISFWFVKSFNKVFEGLINHSPAGNALGTLLNVAGYEYMTRRGVDQPILKKSHEEMKHIDKDRYGKKPNFILRAMGGKIKRKQDNTVVVGSTPIRPLASQGLNPKFAFLGYNYFNNNQQK